MARYIRWTLLLAVLVPLGGTSVLAAALPIPPSLYPAGAHMSFRAHVSNHEMDCLWGFICEGTQPLFHTVGQDTLHRVEGWAEFARGHIPHQGDMGFELFASTYSQGLDANGLPWAQAAAADFGTAATRQGYRRASIRALQREMRNSWLDQNCLWLDTTGLIAAGCWTGESEIEAIVAYNGRSALERRLGLSLLSRQIRAAVSAVPK